MLSKMLIESFPILARFPQWVPWLRTTKGRAKGRIFFQHLAKEAFEDNPNPSNCACLQSQCMLCLTHVAGRDIYEHYVDQYKLDNEESKCEFVCDSYA